MMAISTFVFLFLVWLMIVRSFSWKMASVSGAILVIWLSGVIYLSQLGFFATNPLFAPNIFLGFLILFGLLRRLLSSSVMKKFVETVPISWLIVIQTYRVVGYVFFTYYQQGLLPAVFAFPAAIGDMIVGLTAPLVAFLYFLKKPYARKVAILWNIVGIVDLVIALGVGILAFPRPIHFLPILSTAVSTEAISLYPLAVVPLFAVPLALVLHLICLKILKGRK